MFPSLSLVPGLLNGSLPPNGSESHPPRVFIFVFGDVAKDPNERGLFDLGGAGRGGGAFFCLPVKSGLVDDLNGSGLVPTGCKT